MMVQSDPLGLSPPREAFAIEPDPIVCQCRMIVRYESAHDIGFQLIETRIAEPSATLLNFARADDARADHIAAPPGLISRRCLGVE